MLFTITIVVQALLWGSWVNAQYHDGMYLEFKNYYKCYACPKLLQGICYQSRLFQEMYRYEKRFYRFEIAFNYRACDYCYDGCTQFVDGRYNCSDCKPGRWGQWCQYSCIPCSECQNHPCDVICTERNDTIACSNSECPDICSVGFYGIQTSKRGACPRFCGDCREQQCHSCLSGHYMYIHNGTQICKVCPRRSRNCKLDTFNNNKIQDTSCPIQFYLHKQDGHITCKSCPYACLNCKQDTFNFNNVQCTSCIDKHYLDYRKQVVCSACPQRCEECEINFLHINKLQCTRCVSGFYLDTSNNRMIGCRKCPIGYDECETFSNKIQCIRGYYLNFSDQDEIVECSKCPKQCISCKLDFFQNKFEINCTSCLNGFYLIYGHGKVQRCVKCPFPCETCEEQLYLPECTSCKQGYYFNYANERFEKCSQCPNGCMACRLVSVHAKIPDCFSCKDGFSFKNKDGIGVCIIYASRSYGSLVFVVAFVAFVVLVLVLVACFKLSENVIHRENNFVAEETKKFERSNDHSKQRQERLEDFSPKWAKNDDEWQAIGSHIYYNPKKVIGKGSKAVVFEGRYGLYIEKEIAVKNIRITDHKEAEEYNAEIKKMYREIKVNETLIEHYRHPNIVDFITSFIDIKCNILYIAFELGKGTLVDYVKESNKLWRETLKCLDVNRHISEGLKYVHEKGIVHRDLKPSNIFIVERSCKMLVAVIGDFGSAKPTTVGSFCSLTGRMGSVGYIAPEIWEALSRDASESLALRCNKKSDIFSAAILFYFTLSLGDHPFGNEMTAQDCIQKYRVPLFYKIKSIRNSYAHKSLIERMLKRKPEERPTAREVCLFPANWTEKKIINYFKEKSDEFENLIKIDPSRATLLEDPGLIPNGNWMNNLPVNTRLYLNNYKLNKCSSSLYSGKETNVRALLRAIRNTNSHYLQYPRNVQSELGDYPEGHVDMWLMVCPKLLLHVIKILGLPYNP